MTAAAPVSAAASGTAAASIATVMNFGDSITCGYYASPADGMGNIYSAHGYAGIFDAALGKPAQNLCRAGDQAADMARLWVYPNASPTVDGRQLFTVMIGTNDAGVCGGSAACLANWRQSLAASLAWLALPAGDKVTAAGAVASSHGWRQDPDYSMGAITNTPGATLQLTVQQAVAGRTLWLAYRVFDRAAGSAVVSIDGGAQTALAAQVNTGHVLSTQNGSTDTIFLAGLPLGAAGTHRVSVTATSGDGAGFSLLWAAASNASYAALAGAPRVLLGQVPISMNSELNGRIALYNEALQSLAASLAQEGMNIQVVPTYAGLDPATDLTDTVHPNNAGHAALAAVFLRAL